MAAKAFKRSFLHRCEEVAIQLMQLPNGPADVHACTCGEAGVVDALDEVWHVVRVRRRSLGGAGERGNEELRSDWRGSCEELASALPPVRRTRVGPSGFERCGCKVGSCSMQEVPAAGREEDCEVGALGGR